MQLGDRLRTIRSTKGMTLAELSTGAGVSRSMLSRIERNEAAPTITTLQKIARSLDVTIGRLVEDDRSDPDTPGGDLPPEHGSSTPLRTAAAERRIGPAAVSVVRADRRKRMVLPWGANYDLLTPDLQRRIEFILISYPVNGGSGDLYSHEGEECGFVIEGRFNGVVGDQEFTLEPGDSISYPSTLPHRWENAGDTEARAVWAVTPPSFLIGRMVD
jgi:transcriptional regulator with XRE-family HTH domain